MLFFRENEENWVWCYYIASRIEKFRFCLWFSPAGTFRLFLPPYLSWKTSTLLPLVLPGVRWLLEGKLFGPECASDYLYPGQRQWLPTGNAIQMLLIAARICTTCSASLRINTAPLLVCRCLFLWEASVICKLQGEEVRNAIYINGHVPAQPSPGFVVKSRGWRISMIAMHSV